jgi:hypothetical protein
MLTRLSDADACKVYFLLDFAWGWMLIMCITRETGESYWMLAASLKKKKNNDLTTR